MKNVVYVRFPHGGKDYLYEVPEGVKLVANDEVFVEARRIPTPIHVTCTTDSFLIPDEALQILIRQVLGDCDLPLAKVVGRAVPTFKVGGFNE